MGRTHSHLLTFSDTRRHRHTDSGRDTPRIQDFGTQSQHPFYLDRDIHTQMGKDRHGHVWTCELPVCRDSQTHIAAQRHPDVHRDQRRARKGQHPSLWKVTD
jgi:hypothetical protein